MPKIKGNQVVTANDLRSGEVVFWTGHGWSTDHAEAQVLRDPDAQEAALSMAQADGLRVVDAYLAAVGERVEPVRYREWLRTQGPTVRPDLGKQSEPNHRAA